MHGSILMALRRYVVKSYDEATWEALLAEVGTPGRLFTSLGDYPDGDVMALVGAACAATGQDADAVLSGFGRFLAADLVATYPFLVDRSWTAFDLIEKTEGTIHTVVRARQVGARPPMLVATRRGPEHVSVRYDSSRRLCALARGIILGVGDHYGTPLQVNETTCSRKGAPACQIEVLPAWSAPVQRDEQATPLRLG
ncbi:MAG: heme NO-binding domain-containing protein [Mycobacteriales bacterium]